MILSSQLVIGTLLFALPVDFEGGELYFPDNNIEYKPQ